MCASPGQTATQVKGGLYLQQNAGPAGDGSQEKDSPDDEMNGAPGKEGSNALEAFLDSAPDPFRGRRPSGTQARLVCHLKPAAYRPIA